MSTSSFLQKDCACDRTPIDHGTINRIQNRHTGLRNWLSVHAREDIEKQAHLDHETAERAYWHMDTLWLYETFLRS